MYHLFAFFRGSIKLGFFSTLICLIFVCAGVSFAQTPSVTSVNLTSTSGNNTNDDDLNIAFTLAGSATTSATSWYRNGSPVMTLFMPFEGGTSSIYRDISGSSSTVATTVGSPTWNATGGHDGYGAMVFSGSDYLLAGSNTFPVHSSYTQSAWFYRTSMGSMGYGFIIAGQAPYVQTHGLRVTSDGRVSVGQNNNYRIVQTYPDIINLNTWYFVATTYDNSNGIMILYLNGQPVDTAIVPVAQRDISDGGVMIGATYGGENRFVGRIDDVRIYKQVLSKEQILTLYTSSTKLAAPESFVGDSWQAMVTPFSSSAMGTTVSSNSITIIPTVPIITSTPVTAGIVNKLYQYKVVATGGPTPTFSLTNAPIGMTIDATSGLIKWTPSASGFFPVTIQTSNSQGTGIQNFTISVALPSVGVTNVSLAASGTNELTTSYTLTLDASTSATAWYKNGNPTMILYMPMEGGSMWALDDASGNNITCTPIGDPVFNPTGGHDGKGCYEFNGNNYLIAGNMFPVNASYTKCAWVYHTVSGGFTHIISGWQHGSGNYPPSGHGLRVTNDNRLSAGHNGNWKIVNTPAGTIANNTWYFVAVTFDYASATMQLYINGARVDSQAVSSAYMNYNDSSLLIGSTQGSFCWPGRIDDARVYGYALSKEQIASLYTANGGNKIVGSDVHTGETWQARVMPYSATEAGTMVSSNPITIGSTNHAPVLVSIGPHSVNEGQTLSFNISASDPDGTIPVLSASPLMTNATFIDNNNGSGTFTFNPSYTQAGTYNVTFTASDNSLSASETVVITVNNVNRAPVLASIGSHSVNEGETLTFNISTSDPDGTTPILSATPLMANAAFVDNTNGTGTFTFNPSFTQAGTYDIIFITSDNLLSDSETVTITVHNINQPPILAAIDSQIVVEGSSLTFNIIASDPDNEKLVLSAENLPINATFVDQTNDTGIFVFNPVTGQEGVYHVTFKVTDSSMALASIDVIITVYSTPPPTNWAATLRVDGEVVGNALNSSEVIIGMGDKDITTPGSPKPPEYTAFVQLWKAGWDGPYYKDIQKSGGLCYYWILDVDPHGPVAPPATSRCATISWDPAQLSFARHYVLREGSDLSGAIVVADMRTTSSYQVCDIQTSRYFTVEWFDDACASKTFVNLNLSSGWNLVSLPVIPDTSAVTKLFPTAQAVFEFNGLYQEATTMTAGKGYWVKVPTATSVTLSGQAVTDISVSLNAGWNLVGAPNCTVVPTTTPSGNIEAIFSFNTMYQLETHLMPGLGYWIKSSSASTLTASCALPAPALASVSSDNSEFQTTGIVTLHVTGENIDGANQAEIVLGVGQNTQTIPQPPSMPLYSVQMMLYSQDWQGPFYKDIQNNQSEINSWIIAVNPHGNTHNHNIGSATLTWDPAQLGNDKFELREGSDGNGKVLVSDMRNQSSLVITGNDALQYFTVTRSSNGNNSLPGDFSLAQNYPNPFNPSTQIGYSLPTAQHVKLEVYNMLGQKVKTIIDQTVEAGNHVATWDATDDNGREVSSGVYFYRLASDTNSARKKMLLLR